MLNQPLYDKLSEIFPTKVGMTGKNRTATVVPDKTSSGTPLQRKSSDRRVRVKDWGEVYKVRCPVCEDKKQRLFISHVSGQSVEVEGETHTLGWVYVCHNEHCRLGQYLRPEYLQGMPALEQVPDVLDHVPVHQEVCSYWKDYRTVDFPETPKKFHDYLRKRGFDPFEVARLYGIGYAEEGEPWYVATQKQKNNGIITRYSKEDRLIIPIDNKGLLQGFQSRRIDDVSIMKYLNQPTGLRKSELLYNLDQALMQTAVVIVEGVTDVWKVGICGIGTFGRELSEWQEWAITTGWRYDGICLYIPDRNDPLALPYAREKVAKWNAEEVFPRGAYVMELKEGMDPGMVETDVLRKWINDTIVYYDNQRILNAG